MMQSLFLSFLIIFSFLISDPDRETLALTCGHNLSEVLQNTRLINGENYLCDIDRNIKMYAIVGTGLINGWSFKHINGQIVNAEFIGARDPIAPRMNCVKFKLLKVFDYKDIIFDVCHPALNMRRVTN
ncbi:MAG: hypothetical protein IPH93_00640 [Saprospiraceae bacterium]|nr:hypothetical protein [Saprospiraceae bacterium]MBK7810019.1 hypothetical protein [Saprospiraceae bacterium]MBK9629620.1 hypothetical protein [Saprospiraceae bacterium]